MKARVFVAPPVEQTRRSARRSSLSSPIDMAIALRARPGREQWDLVLHTGCCDGGSCSSRPRIRAVLHVMILVDSAVCVTSEASRACYASIAMLVTDPGGRKGDARAIATREGLARAVEAGWTALVAFAPSGATRETSGTHAPPGRGRAWLHQWAWCALLACKRCKRDSGEWRRADVVCRSRPYLSRCHPNHHHHHQVLHNRTGGVWQLPGRRFGFPLSNMTG